MERRLPAPAASGQDPRRGPGHVPDLDRRGRGAQGPLPAQAAAAVQGAADRRPGRMRLSRHDLRRRRRVRADSRTAPSPARGPRPRLSGPRTPRHRLGVDGRSGEGGRQRRVRPSADVRPGLGKPPGRRAAHPVRLRQRGRKPDRSGARDLRPSDHAGQRVPCRRARGVRDRRRSDPGLPLDPRRPADPAVRAARPVRGQRRPLAVFLSPPAEYRRDRLRQRRRRPGVDGETAGARACGYSPSIS